MTTGHTTDSMTLGTITCTTCNHAASVLSPSWRFVSGRYEGVDYTVPLCGHCDSKISEKATGNIMSAIKQEMRLRERRLMQ